MLDCGVRDLPLAASMRTFHEGARACAHRWAGGLATSTARWLVGSLTGQRVGFWLGCLAAPVRLATSRYLSVFGAQLIGCLAGRLARDQPVWLAGWLVGSLADGLAGALPS